MATMSSGPPVIVYARKSQPRLDTEEEGKATPVITPTTTPALNNGTSMGHVDSKILYAACTGGSLKDNEAQATTEESPKTENAMTNTNGALHNGISAVSSGKQKPKDSAATSSKINDNKPSLKPGSKNRNLKHPCTYCRKAFPNQVTLENHMIIHNRPQMNLTPYMKPTVLPPKGKGKPVALNSIATSPKPNDQAGLPIKKRGRPHKSLQSSPQDEGKTNSDSKNQDELPNDNTEEKVNSTPIPLSSIKKEPLSPSPEVVTNNEVASTGMSRTQRKRNPPKWMDYEISYVATPKRANVSRKNDQDIASLAKAQVTKNATKEKRLSEQPAKQTSASPKPIKLEKTQNQRKRNVEVAKSTLQNSTVVNGVSEKQSDIKFETSIVIDKHKEGNTTGAGKRKKSRRSLTMKMKSAARKTLNAAQRTPTASPSKELSKPASSTASVQVTPVKQETPCETAPTPTISKAEADTQNNLSPTISNPKLPATRTVTPKLVVDTPSTPISSCKLNVEVQQGQDEEQESVTTWSTPKTSVNGDAVVNGDNVVSESETNLYNNNVAEEAGLINFAGMPKLLNQSSVEYEGEEEFMDSSSDDDKDYDHLDIKVPDSRKNPSEPYIKDAALKFLATKISNRNMLRIREELMTLKESGNYFKLTKTAPLAAGLVHDLFCVLDINKRRQQ